MSKKLQRIRWLALAAPVLLFQGCLLVFEGGDFQSLTLHFTVDRDLPAGEETLVQTLHQPNRVGIKRRWVRFSGSLMPPQGGAKPARLIVTVRVEDAESGKDLLRFRAPVAVNAQGNFTKAKKFRKDLPEGSMQSVFVEPVGGDIVAGTMVWLCVDVAAKKADLKDIEDCRASAQAPPGDGVVVVEVHDNAFTPKRVQINPGQTVRWVLRGSDTTHTVTAKEGGRFDHGVGSLTTQGATVEVRFGAADDGQTYEYLCETHADCCEMQGSIRVGENAPEPDDRY